MTTGRGLRYRSAADGHVTTRTSLPGAIVLWTLLAEGEL